MNLFEHRARGGILSFVVGCTWLLLAAVAHPQPAYEQLFRSYNNVDIRVIIEDVQAFTGRRIVVGPRVRGSISSWQVARQLTPEEFYKMFLRWVESLDYTAVEASGVLYIMTDSNAD